MQQQTPEILSERQKRICRAMAVPEDAYAAIARKGIVANPNTPAEVLDKARDHFPAIVYRLRGATLEDVIFNYHHGQLEADILLANGKLMLTVIDPIHNLRGLIWPSNPERNRSTEGEPLPAPSSLAPCPSEHQEPA